MFRTLLINQLHLNTPYTNEDPFLETVSLTERRLVLYCNAMRLLSISKKGYLGRFHFNLGPGNTKYPVAHQKRHDFNLKFKANQCYKRCWFTTGTD